MNPSIPDPFSYSKWDWLTTLVQLATVVTGLILASQGEMTGLLALGALAGGGKGTLVTDFLRKVAEELNTPKPKGRSDRFHHLFVLCAVLAGSFVLSGCGTVSKQFVIDSKQAVLAQAHDYLNGCEQVTIAPAFSVDWNDQVSYGGGVFAGCEVEGRLLRVRCESDEDEETGQTRLNCKPISVWMRKEEAK